VKMVIRVTVSLICSVFGALTISVTTCNAQRRPGWVEGVCRHHVELIWLLSVPLLLGLTYATWAQPLVWVLALAYTGAWVYGIYLAAAAGYFQKSPLGVGVLSLFPGTVFLLMAGYCCYAVSQRDA
jgi:hypothetical protein